MFDKKTKSETMADSPEDAGPALSAEHIAACEAAGIDPAQIAEDDPALTGIPRDETQDSIDVHTGTLTDEAVARRREMAGAGD